MKLYSTILQTTEELGFMYGTYVLASANIPIACGLYIGIKLLLRPIDSN